MAGKRPRNRSLKGTQTFKLFAPETALGWRVIRNVSGAQGEEMLAQGKWRDVYDESGNHIGYQTLPGFRSDQEMLSRTSRASITVRECELNAGRFFAGGRSRTAGMTEEQRISRRSRYGKPLVPEDDVELAQEKVKLWPHPANVIGQDKDGKPVYGDRSVRVYPKS